MNFLRKYLFWAIILQPLNSFALNTADLTAISSLSVNTTYLSSTTYDHWSMEFFECDNGVYIPPKWGLENARHFFPDAVSTTGHTVKYAALLTSGPKPIDLVNELLQDDAEELRSVTSQPTLANCSPNRTGWFLLLATLKHGTTTENLELFSALGGPITPASCAVNSELIIDLGTTIKGSTVTNSAPLDIECDRDASIEWSLLEGNSEVTLDNDIVKLHMNGQDFPVKLDVKKNQPISVEISGSISSVSNSPGEHQASTILVGTWD
ncbi:hypothetical protein [Klebsiella aerogenes]|uniref:hypothetical protein n=1 Tax=Klebsiella aerogenes TaxID=548 RepID=UPI00254E4085|nr:hypothetical protein [Klebsiella aerogenes]MDK7100080.1 hypothetical protein [Klebsiella aerogenes]MDK7645549.1 hypothetical protein [Klebsiella aerogenes]MDK7850452.1 hypothetical protein [Klebsiella aerogenes]MDK8313039.1 hypothetical protein [Klebsiella aerogenes]